MRFAEYAHKLGCRSKSLMESALILSRPGILALVALAGFSGMVMAAGRLPGVRVSLMTLLVLSMAAAGSAMLNGVLDYPLDIRMVRLQARVEALVHLGGKQVVALASCLILAAITLALWHLNALTAVLLLAAVLIYVVPYTLWLKRRSPFAAVAGGIPGALPVLVGYAAVADTIRPSVLILFGIVMLWQPPHFWILALKHREDYRNSGFAVLPAAMGERPAKVFIFFFAATLLPASLTLGLVAAFSPWYHSLAAVSAVLFLAACYFQVIRRPLFGQAFNASIWYISVLFIAIITEICLVRICTVSA